MPTDAAAALSGWSGPHLGKVGLRRPGKLHSSSVECCHAHGRFGGVAGWSAPHLGKVGLRPGKLHTSSVECPHAHGRCGGVVGCSGPHLGKVGLRAGQAPQFSVECPHAHGRCGGVAGWPGPHLGKVGLRRRASSTVQCGVPLTPTDAAAALRVGQDPTLERWGFGTGQAPQFSVECYHTHGRLGGVAGWSGPHLGKVGLRRRASSTVQCGVLPCPRTLRRCCGLFRTPPWKGGASAPGKLHSSVWSAIMPADASAAFRVGQDPTLERWGFGAGQAPQFQCGGPSETLIRAICVIRELTPR